MSNLKPDKRTYLVGNCKICGVDALTLWACGDCGSVVIVCDECDAAWPDAEVQSPAATTGNTTLPCPQCSSDLYEPPCRWATPEEVASTEWLTSAVQEGKIELHES